MNGIIVIDKPPRFTSFDVVAVMRGLFGTKKGGTHRDLRPDGYRRFANFDRQRY